VGSDGFLRPGVAEVEPTVDVARAKGLVSPVQRVWKWMLDGELPNGDTRVTIERFA
jgi:hypothetical protein